MVHPRFFYSAAYAPFGEAYDETGTQDRTFTGQSSNLNSAFYDFMYREMSGQQQGRWISPDPAGLAAVDITNPQSWNRYAYLTNNPLNQTDPVGLDHWASAGNCSLHYTTAMFMGDDGVLRENVLLDFVSCAASTLGDFGAIGDTIVTGFDTGGGGSGFTLGIRAPGQTFTNCMSANASTYSIGGSIELAANVATGTNTSYSSNVLIGAVTGNSVNTLLFGFGSTSDAAAGMAVQAPGLVGAGMGSAITFGRRSSTIMSLNFAGIPGGPPLALSQASAEVKAALGSVGKALSLGMSFATRTAVDVGLSAAEAINCSMSR
jgi:RHS repeat-associated protein